VLKLVCEASDRSRSCSTIRGGRGESDLLLSEARSRSRPFSEARVALRLDLVGLFSQGFGLTEDFASAAGRT
jgi:hypothetical protein